MVSLVLFPLEDTTHTHAKECMRGGAPWYVPRKDGFLKTLGPMLMSE
jgi:hypothetical protein